MGHRVYAYTSAYILAFRISKHSTEEEILAQAHQDRGNLRYCFFPIGRINERHRLRHCHPDVQRIRCRSNHYANHHCLDYNSQRYHHASVRYKTHQRARKIQGPK